MLTKQPELILIAIIFWAIPLYVNRNFILNGRYNNNNSYLMFIVLLLLYSILGLAEADTYHYQELYHTMVKYNSCVHVEPYYFKLVQLIPNSYWLWRFAIWGVAAYIIVIVLKIHKISPLSISIMAPLLFFKQFTLTRGSLGFAIMMLAITLIMSKGKNLRFVQILIGGVFLVLSIYLHRSISIFILLLPIAYLLKLNKFTFYLSLLAFPVLYGMVKLFLENLITTNFITGDSLNFFESYYEDNASTTTMWGYIGYVVIYAPLFYLFYLLIKYYIIDKNKLSNDKYYLLKLSYILFYISCLFFDQDFSSFMSSRSLHAAMFPMLIISSQYLDDCGFNNQNKRMIISLIFSGLYWYLYLIYSWAR